MDYFLQLGLFFIVGLLLESLLLLKSKIGKVELFIIGFCLLLASASSLYFLKGNYSHENLIGGISIFAFVFLTTFAWIFMSRLLITINELTLLIWNLIFLYLYFSKFAHFNLLSVVVIMLSLATLLNAFLKMKINSFFKAIFYTWFLVMLSYFAISQFSLNNLAFLDKNENFQTISRQSTFFTGMALAYIVIYGWYLLRLIPIPSKHQTFRSRISEWKEEVQLMISKYSEEEFSYRKNILTFVSVAIFLLINYRIHFIGNSLIISLGIAISSIISSGKSRAVIEKV